MSWFYLVAAGLFEMTGVLMINIYHRAKSIVSLALLIIAFLLSFLFLSLALENLPMGTAYAVWTGTGAAGGALMGMIFFQESAEWKRVFCVFLIIASAVGLKLIE
ncbi:multidrug efflux SMR transporter [Halobacillus sp. A1]|uniref:DMT family transporter n=1 Tax=Halobacillus sp. A1 TaxID=2880262 RepID=UPI0020A6B10E|nr:multidrug efflux SMR transporter [Halobacillus sp. A1]MCP3031318.1 multidrug efflux SMR transporter [Halobacillus sp. A1]